MRLPMRGWALLGDSGARAPARAGDRSPAAVAPPDAWRPRAPGRRRGGSRAAAASERSAARARARWLRAGGLSPATILVLVLRGTSNVLSSRCARWHPPAASGYGHPRTPRREVRVSRTYAATDRQAAAQYLRMRSRVTAVALRMSGDGNLAGGAWIRMQGSARQLRADRWACYFSHLAAGDPGRLVAVEVLADQPGGRAARSGRRLCGIAFDAAADVLEISEGDLGAGDTLALRHFICAPRSIVVRDHGQPGTSEILVEDASGVCTRIDVFSPPLAPRPRRRARRGTCRPASPSRHAARRAVGFDARRLDARTASRR